MKALTLNHDGYARSAPDSIQLTDLSEFVTLNDIDVPAPKAGEVKILGFEDGVSTTEIIRKINAS